MEHSSSRLPLTQKQLVGLLYLGIALVAVALATTETYGNVQWLSALNRLDLKVVDASFHLDGQPLGYPFVRVNASVNNPAGLKGITLLDVVYSVYVSSVNENFSVRGSSIVGIKVNSINQMIPAEGGMNLTFAFGLLPGVNDSPDYFLRGFLNRTRTDVITYVGLTLYFRSVYGAFSNDYCHVLPRNIATVCPEGRAAVPRFNGGGGG